MGLPSCACDHKELTVHANNESPLPRHVKWDYRPVPVTTVTCRISNESPLLRHVKWYYLYVHVTTVTSRVSNESILPRHVKWDYLPVPVTTRNPECMPILNLCCLAVSKWVIIQCLKLQALVYDILSPGGRCRKAMLVVCLGSQ